MIWYILGVIAIISLVVYWRKRGAVWGGLTIGVFIGLIVSIFYLLKGKGFSWVTIGKGAILGPIAGLFAELLGMAGDYFKKKKS
jgi:hypothetical protein